MLAVGVPLIFNMGGIFWSFGMNPHQNSTLFQTVLIVFDAFLRHAPSHQSANQATPSSACTSAGNRCCERPRNHQPESW